MIPEGNPTPLAKPRRVQCQYLDRLVDHSKHKTTMCAARGGYILARAMLPSHLPRSPARTTTPTALSIARCCSDSHMYVYIYIYICITYRSQNTTLCVYVCIPHNLYWYHERSDESAPCRREQHDEPEDEEDARLPAYISLSLSIYIYIYAYVYIYIYNTYTHMLSKQNRRDSAALVSFCSATHRLAEI